MILENFRGYLIQFLLLYYLFQIENLTVSKVVFGQGCFHHLYLNFFNSFIKTSGPHATKCCLAIFPLPISLTHFPLFWDRSYKTEWWEKLVFKTPKLSSYGKVVNTLTSVGPTTVTGHITCSTFTPPNCHMHPISTNSLHSLIRPPKAKTKSSLLLSQTHGNTRRRNKLQHPILITLPNPWSSSSGL